MANRWLFKTEPGEYAFEDLVRDRRTSWDGVTNPLALRYLRQVTKGDPILIYHTGAVRAAVGLAKAASDPYPDPGKRDPRLVVVDVVADRPLPRPVLLRAIKGQPKFRAFDLVRLPRLSVMPVGLSHWMALLEMAGT